jgi:hypothetical protein
MLKTVFLFCMCLFGFSLYAEENPVVYLISTPRSLSTVFTRMMLGRGDFSVFSEPSEWAYALTLEYQWSGMRTEEVEWEKDIVFRTDGPRTFEEVKQRIFKEAKKKPVFVKEMSFAVLEFLLNDLKFVKNPQVHFVFLIRNPHHSVISFYNKLDSITKTWKNEVGYEAEHRLFQHIKKHARHKPLIIQAEDLYFHSEEVIEKLCRKLKIPHLQESLSWNMISETFNGDEWHEVKHPMIMHVWHDEAFKSTGFHIPAKYEEDDQGNPTFAEIIDSNDRSICREVYQFNKQFYDKLRMERDYMISSE